MNWLQELLEKLFSVCPRIQCIQPDEGGIRVTLGTRIKLLVPGWYFYLPCVQLITVVTVTPQPVDLRGQSIISQGRDFTISGSILYRIDNAEKAILAVQDFDRSLTVMGLGIIARYSKSHDLSLPEAFEELESDILKGVRGVASGWGLKIMKVYITDLGTVQNIRVIGDTTAVPIIGEEDD